MCFKLWATPQRLLFLTFLPKLCLSFNRILWSCLVQHVCLSKEDASYYLTLSKHHGFQLVSKHLVTVNSTGETITPSFPLPHTERCKKKKKMFFDSSLQESYFLVALQMVLQGQHMVLAQAHKALTLAPEVRTGNAQVILWEWVNTRHNCHFVFACAPYKEAKTIGCSVVEMLNKKKEKKIQNITTWEHNVLAGLKIKWQFNDQERFAQPECMQYTYSRWRPMTASFLAPYRDCTFVAFDSIHATSRLLRALPSALKCAFCLLSVLCISEKLESFGSFVKKALRIYSDCEWHRQKKNM